MREDAFRPVGALPTLGENNNKRQVIEIIMIIKIMSKNNPNETIATMRITKRRLVINRKTILLLLLFETVVLLTEALQLQQGFGVNWTFYKTGEP